MRATLAVVVIILLALQTAFAACGPYAEQVGSDVQGDAQSGDGGGAEVDDKGGNVGTPTVLRAEPSTGDGDVKTGGTNGDFATPTAGGDEEEPTGFDNDAKARASTEDLDGTEWTLSLLHSRSPVEGSHINLEFADGLVRGFAGCNTYRSLIIGSDPDRYRYTALEDGTLTIPGFMVTEKDCSEPEGVAQQEATYVEALQNAAGYRLAGDRLEIENALGETTLVFERKVAFPTHPGDLEDSEWALTLMNGEELLEDTHISLSFSDGQVGGFAGCNTYGAAFLVVSDATLTVPEMELTQMLCHEPDGVMQQEESFISTLQQAAAHRVTDDGLEIQNASGETTLVFSRMVTIPMDASALVGTMWQLDSMNGVRPIEGSAITLVFRSEHEYGGHAGCTGYVGSYKASDDDMELAMIAMTGSNQGCSEALMSQEGEYTTNLGWATDYRLEEARLELLTIRGEVLVFGRLPTDASAGLERTRWALTAFVETNAVEGMATPALIPEVLLTGTEVTVTFEDGIAQGSAGCNSYNAVYALEGSTITIETPAATEIGCAEPAGILEQEQRYLGLLEEATAIGVTGSQLWLDTADGWTLVFDEQH